LAYISDETGRAEVYVQRLSAGTRQMAGIAQGGRLARWRRDCRELCLSKAEGKVRFYSAPVRPRDTGLEFDAPALILETNMASRRNELFHPQPGWPALGDEPSASGALQPSLTVMLDWSRIDEMTAAV